MSGSQRNVRHLIVGMAYVARTYKNLLWKVVVCFASYGENSKRVATMPFSQERKKVIPTQNRGPESYHFRDQPRQGVPANMALTLKQTLTLSGPAAGPRFSRHLRRSSLSLATFRAPPFANVPAHLAPTVDFGRRDRQKVTTCACCEPHALGTLPGMRSSGWNHFRDDAG